MGRGGAVGPVAVATDVLALLDGCETSDVAVRSPDPGQVVVEVASDVIEEAVYEPSDVESFIATRTACGVRIDVETV